MFISTLVSFLGAGGKGKDPAEIEEISQHDEQLLVSRLITYPIKSCAGVQLDESSYSLEGLEWDRRWCVLDSRTRKMITARTHPKLFLIQPKLDLINRNLEVHIPYHGTFMTPLEPSKDIEELTDLQLWGSYDMCGRVVAPKGSELAQAISSFIEADAELVYATQTQPRILGKQSFLDDLFSSNTDALDYPLEECTTRYADGYPILIATEATFREVGQWLEAETKDIRMGQDELIARYRPNIVVTGNREGFLEESWEELCLDGKDILYPVSRCPRCPMPDASPVTGVMSPRRMPGKIVEGHRSRVDRINKGPCLGMNTITKARSGRLRVGATVTVTRASARTEGFSHGRFDRPEDAW